MCVNRENILGQILCTVHYMSRYSVQYSESGAPLQKYLSSPVTPLRYLKNNANLHVSVSELLRQNIELLNVRLMS